MTSNTDLAILFAKRAYLLPNTPDEIETGEHMIDFTFGHPDPSFFPVENLQKAAVEVLASSANTALQYSSFRGCEELLEVLVSYLSGKLNLRLGTQNLIVTNGSMQVLGLMAAVFIEPSDLVLTEAPTYFRAVTIFRNHEAVVEEVPVDQAGLQTDSLEEILSSKSKTGLMPKFLYTIPTHQNPSGVTMTLDRRQQLLDLSSRFGFIILEDTAYNELWYDETPPPSLFELDAGGGRVIQMGTFSKIMAPGLAIGWALGPKSVITRFVEFKVNGGTTPLTSLIVATFLTDNYFNTYVESLRVIYKEKRDAMIAALEEYMRESAVWYRPGGGYFVWLQLRSDAQLDTLRKIALSEGVVFLPGEYCFANPEKGLHQVRLAFSALSPSEIREGVRRFSLAFKP